MKKFMIGCLAVVLVLVVAGGATSYFVVIKPMWEMGSSAVAFVQDYEKLNNQIEARDDFRPPEDGSFSEDQFKRFLVARRAIADAMGDKLEEFRGHYEKLEKELKDKDRDPNIREQLGAYKDVGELVITAKQAQVKALNRYNFSLAEYAYIQHQSYRALGQQVAVASLGDEQSPSTGGGIPDDVVAMVAPHREELMKSYALAWFGI